MYTSDINAPFQFGVGFMPIKPPDIVSNDNVKNEEVYSLFKSVIENILEDSEFQKNPRKFVVKWVEKFEKLGMYLMPESIVAAYFRRTYLGQTYSCDDINWFGNIKYPWEKV